MGVITKNELLRQVLEIAGTQAAIARKMDLPTSRIAELYRSLSPPPPPVEGEKQKKPRDLKYKEIKQLAELYDIDLQPERRTVRAEPAAPTRATIPGIRSRRYDFCIIALDWSLRLS